MKRSKAKKAVVAAVGGAGGAGLARPGKGQVQLRQPRTKLATTRKVRRKTQSASARTDVMYNVHSTLGTLAINVKKLKHNCKPFQ